MTTSYLTDLRTLWVVRGYPHYFMFKLLVASSAWINTALMLPILIFKFEASPTQMAVISLVTGAPFVILGPYLGSLADRKSPIAMMIGGAVYRSFMLAGLAFAPSIEVFALIMFLNAVGSSANVADPVITRRLLTDDQIVTATSIRGLLDQSTKLVAPLIGAGLALGTSSQRALLVPAAMAALSAWCMILLGRRVGSLPAAPSSGKKEQRNLRALRNILATNPPIKAIVVLTIGSTITMGMHGSVLLFLLREQALPPNAFAFHMTCTAIGGIAASLVFKKWIIGRDQVKILYWCMTGFCSTILVTGLWGLSSVPIAMGPLLIIWLISGFLFAGKVICFMVLLQTRAPKDKIGLVSASMQSMMTVLFQVTPLIGLMLTEFRSAALAYIVSATLGMVFLLPLSIVRPPFVALTTTSDDAHDSDVARSHRSRS
ncbi:MAG: MFS transporter [Burkholderiaceae bacterium]